jgi:hypothetical protein
MERFILTKLQNKLAQSTDIIAKSKHSSANDFFEEKNFGRGGTGLGRDRFKEKELCQPSGLSDFACQI